MKRIDNLYEECIKLDNIKLCYNNLIKNIKNKRKVEDLRNYKSAYIYKAYEVLLNKNYIPKEYHIFYIYEPKKRLIMAQGTFDKLINHIVYNFILLPSLEKCLIDTNCASRKGYGTRYAIDKYFKYRNICDYKYKKYYILKCDIRKFFQSIDHNILKVKLRKRIKDKDALNILDIIIDSTNEGLPIGNVSSQILAIYYLNDLDHYIKEDLKIKYYIRYMGDFILIHNDYNYLKTCLNKIKEFLKNEKLELNDKTRIYKNNENMNFIGKKRNKKYSDICKVRKKIKKRKQEYFNNEIEINKLISTLVSYEGRK